ncbi:hypothetical protein HPB47_001538 [Ixodes persulcatus]|uniref:Uncharacterized protein n=1 Tax=Ixodes persulcatus TaxID=34615 RepID=A0AC60PQH3_IXOPE|nr:hypothetical protein HPB47_001538 [Ixodes persulcatus]
MPKSRSSKRSDPSFSRPYNTPYAAPSYSQSPQLQASQSQGHRQHGQQVNSNKPKSSKKVKANLSIACWTFQHGTDPPRCYFSRQAWSNQRRVTRGMPDDKVPWIFRGFTMSVMSELSESAHMKPDDDSVYCKGCGGLVLVPEVHEASLLHREHTRPRFSQEPFDTLVEDMLINPEEDDDEEGVDYEGEGGVDGGV